jgi:hypothetical protein
MWQGKQTTENKEHQITLTDGITFTKEKRVGICQVVDVSFNQKYSILSLQEDNLSYSSATRFS